MESGLPNIVGHWQNGAPVQQDLDDFVVVRVGGQDERGNIGGEVGAVRGDGLPALHTRHGSLSLNSSPPSPAIPLSAYTKHKHIYTRQSTYSTDRNTRHTEILDRQKYPFTYKKYFTYRNIRQTRIVDSQE